MQRSLIVPYARTLIGIPWAHEGRTDGGMDCIGFVQNVGAHFGVPFEDLKGYDAAPNGLKFLNHLLKYLTIVPGAVYQDGSIGVFRQYRYPMHVGIFATRDGRRTLIHSSRTAGGVVEVGFVSPQNIVMVLDFPGVEDG